MSMLLISLFVYGGGRAGGPNLQNLVSVVWVWPLVLNFNMPLVFNF